MSENRNIVHYNAGEIDIRDLFMALWNRRIMIISFTLLVAIIAGLVSLFVLSPVYKTELNLVISMPETYTTRFGEYTLPITSNEQYINLIKSNDVIVNTINDMEYNSKEVTVENLKERISIVPNKVSTDSVQNSFNILVSADNPDESLKLAETLFNNYMNFLDVTTKEVAVKFYINYFGVKIETINDSLQHMKEVLEKNEELLVNTTQMIAKGEANFEIQNELTNGSNYIVPIQSANPNYIKIEQDIISNKQSIVSMESNLKMYNNYLDELKEEKGGLNKYYETGRVEKLESTITSIVDTNVILPSQLVAPTQKSSPNVAINILIGVASGFILGIIYALIKEYLFPKA